MTDRPLRALPHQKNNRDQYITNTNDEIYSDNTKMVAFNFIAGLLVLGLASARSTPAPAVRARGPIDCSTVGPSPGGPPCGVGNILTCVTPDTWSCPNGDTGPVPPGTECICNAFRAPGWIPNEGTPSCVSGIECVGLYWFRVCGVSGEEAPQAVPPGTVCRNGGITWP